MVIRTMCRNLLNENGEGFNMAKIMIIGGGGFGKSDATLAALAIAKSKGEICSIHEIIQQNNSYLITRNPPLADPKIILADLKENQTSAIYLPKRKKFKRR